jgi:hypothetical protein
MEISGLPLQLTAVWITRCIGGMEILPWDTSSWMHFQAGKIKIIEKFFRW